MNKGLLLVLVPAILAFALTQAQFGYQPYPGFVVPSGGAGFAGPYGGASPIYTNYATQAAQAAKSSRLVNLSLLFFLGLLATNFTGLFSG